MEFILNVNQTAQLWIVATPIGNLGDITFRAVEILKQADVVAAEDTRTSKRLLQHYAIETMLLSCHEHNEQQAGKKIIGLLNEGKSVALISDAGTPLINDPGYCVVRAVRAAGFQVIPIPGACSPIAALSAAGLPTYQFTYLGFLPRSGRARETCMEQIKQTLHTLVLLESPKRLMQTLNDLLPYIGKREVCVAREITKLFESFVSGDVTTVIQHFAAYPPRGEMVVLLGAGEEKEVDDAMILSCANHPDFLELAPSAKARKIARVLGVAKSRVYPLLMGHK